MMSMTPIRSWNAFSATATNPTGRPPATATKTSRSSFVQLDLNGLRLIRLPVWVQAEKDVITQDIPHGGKHRCPRAQRELNDGLKVAIAELADLDCIVMATER